VTVFGPTAYQPRGVGGRAVPPLSIGLSTVPPVILRATYRPAGQTDAEPRVLDIERSDYDSAFSRRPGRDPARRAPRPRPDDRRL